MRGYLWLIVAVMCLIALAASAHAQHYDGGQEYGHAPLDFTHPHGRGGYQEGHNGGSTMRAFDNGLYPPTRGKCKAWDDLRRVWVKVC